MYVCVCLCTHKENFNSSRINNILTFIERCSIINVIISSFCITERDMTIKIEKNNDSFNVRMLIMALWGYYITCWKLKCFDMCNIYMQITNVHFFVIVTLNLIKKETCNHCLLSHSYTPEIISNILLLNWNIS